MRLPEGFLGAGQLAAQAANFTQLIVALGDGAEVEVAVACVHSPARRRSDSS
jgi:hypothetical protein